MFVKKDAWLGEDMVIYTGALTMSANDLSLSGNNYDINSLFMKDPMVSLSTYPGKKPKDTTTIVTPEGPVIITRTDSLLYWNRGHMTIKVANLKIENGRFKSDRQTDREPYPYFDGQHIFFTDINGQISNASFIGDEK